jgi:hypothetical protein
MAERRMFTGKITESDAFLEMPLSSQCLYFHLCMYADDEGFVKNPKRIQKMIGATEDDLRVLVAKRFVLSYESGIIVIKHWKMHNLIRKDRFHETEYTEEKSMLYIKGNGAYTLDPEQGEPLLTTKWQPNGNQMTTKCHTEVRLGKDSIGKDRLGKDSKDNKEPKHKYGEYNHVMLTDKERDRLMNDYGEAQTLAAIKFLDEYIEEKHYKSNSHNLAMRRWVFDAIKDKQKPKPNSNQSLAEKWGVTL